LLYPFLIQTRKEENMQKYLFNAEQLKQLVEKAIDLFLEYQYKRGYDEPLARSAAVMDVIGSLRTFRGERPVSKPE
jgi:hypothetical protein